MPNRQSPLVFEQIHIEVARNATDDFNPFHDKNKWQLVKQNPFGETIVLGFQLECLIEYQLRLYRLAEAEIPFLDKHQLRFSNYQFTFANAVKCGQEIELGIRKSQFKEGDNPTLSNRVSLKADGKLALLGYKRESRDPLILPELDLHQLGKLGKLRNLGTAPDRAFLAGTGFFLKRKFMTNSNAKNFLSGSLAEQSDYFDELEDRVHYPEIFPTALISCALLEKALKEGHDFERNPMVYTSHKICIDRVCLADLRSNDVLHILVELEDSGGEEHNYRCFGVIGEEHILFRALISLVPLEAILAPSKKEDKE